MATLDRFGVTNDTVTTLFPASVGIPCSESDVCDLAQELFYNRTITAVNLTDIPLSVEAATSIGKALGPGSRCVVQYLKMCRCGLTAEAVRAFCDSFRGNQRLEILDISQNSLRDDGALHAAKLLESSCSTLRSVDLSECKIGPQGAAAISAALKTNTKLKTLILARNKLREAGTQVLCQGLASPSCAVTVLDVSANSINKEGGDALAAVFMQNKSLESISIANNYISDSIPAIALGLCKRGVSARMVDLSRNRISSEICKKMSQVLEGFRFSIACLSVEGNPIGDSGLVALFHAVRGTNLQYLELSGCGLTSHSGVVVADMVASCSLLNSLQLDGNDLGDDAITEVATAYGNSKAMGSINMERTNMGSAGCLALAAAIRKQKKTRALRLAENSKLTPKDVLAMLDSLATINTLEHLDLSDLGLVDSEPLLRGLLAVFVSNEHLKSISLEHNPIAEGFPNQVITREFALTLLDMSAAKEGTPSGDTMVTINKGHGNSTALNVSSNSNKRFQGIASSTPDKGRGQSNNSSAINNSNASHSTAAVVNSAAQLLATTFRPAWATTVPMEHRSSHDDAKHAVTDDDFAEDATRVPLVPHPHSLYSTMYPGYGRGRFSNAIGISSNGDSVPYTLANSRGNGALFIPRMDGESLVRVAPRRPMQHSPYSLISLESNPGGLPVTEDQLRQKFSELDVEGNGYLDRLEFKKMYLSFQSFGLPVSERQLDEIMRKHFAGDERRMNFDEFSVCMLRLAQL
jgi:ribonuclease inhibitor